MDRRTQTRRKLDNIIFPPLAMRCSLLCLPDSLIIYTLFRQLAAQKLIKKEKNKKNEQNGLAVFACHSSVTCLYLTASSRSSKLSDAQYDDRKHGKVSRTVPYNIRHPRHSQALQPGILYSIHSPCNYPNVYCVRGISTLFNRR